MENLIGKRIKELRAHYNMGVKEFASRCGLSHVAVFHLEKGKTLKPHKSSLLRITNVFGTTMDWLLYGKNEMLPSGTREIPLQEELSAIHWKQEAYQELKNKNQLLEKEIERLWQMIGHFTSQEPTQYRKVVGAG